MNPDSIQPSSPQLPSHHASPGLKWVLLLFGIALVATLGYFTWYVGNEQTDPTQESAPSVIDDATGEDDATSTSQADSCDFTSVTATLKPGVTFDLGGEEEFDTVVCGYLTTKEENMAMGDDTPLMKNRAYFNVTTFQQAEFKAALDAQISAGNTVNSLTAGEYQLGCGCSENNKIISDVGDLTDAVSLPKLLASTKQKPVLVKLSFYKEAGRGCTCCNLLDKIEVL